MFAKMELNPAAVVGVQVDSLGAMERDALSDWVSAAMLTALPAYLCLIA